MTRHNDGASSPERLLRNPERRSPTFLAGRPTEATPRIFDPALKQRGSAYRHLITSRADTHQEDRAHRARIEGALAAIALAGLGDDVLVRGSAVMAQWFPEARPPHDLDLVRYGIGRHRSPKELYRLTDQLAEVIRSGLIMGQLGIDADRVELDGIWTYERVEGRRIAAPWRQGELEGVLQIDVTDVEPIAEEPMRQFFSFTGHDVVLGVATPGQSLAWKVLWLLTDKYPEGKDLYDTWLLSQVTDLTPELRRWILAHDQATSAGLRSIEQEAGRRLNRLELGRFVAEYPDLAARVDIRTMITDVVQFLSGVET